MIYLCLWLLRRLCHPNTESGAGEALECRCLDDCWMYLLTSLMCNSKSLLPVGFKVYGGCKDQSMPLASIIGCSFQLFSLMLHWWKLYLMVSLQHLYGRLCFLLLSSSSFYSSWWRMWWLFILMTWPIQHSWGFEEYNMYAGSVCLLQAFYVGSFVLASNATNETKGLQAEIFQLRWALYFYLHCEIDRGCL